MGKKLSLGCQKIVIENITKKNHLQVTFSKGHSGPFKKASKLCTLCRVEMAIIVFSPTSKAFSFDHSEVNAVIDRFLARRPKTAKPAPASQILETHQNNICGLNFMLTQLLNQIDFERKKGEEHERLRRANKKQVWWESRIARLWKMGARAAEAGSEGAQE